MAAPYAPPTPVYAPAPYVPPAAAAAAPIPPVAAPAATPTAFGGPVPLTPIIIPSSADALGAVGGGEADEEGFFVSVKKGLLGLPLIALIPLLALLTVVVPVVTVVAFGGGGGGGGAGDWLKRKLAKLLSFLFPALLIKLKEEERYPDYYPDYGPYGGPEMYAPYPTYSPYKDDLLRKRRQGDGQGDGQGESSTSGTGSASPVLSAKQVERFTAVVFAALRSQECVQRMLCEAGALGRSFSVVHAVARSVETLVPASLKSSYDIFTNEDRCDKFACGDLAAKKK